MRGLHSTLSMLPECFAECNQIGSASCSEWSSDVCSSDLATDLIHKSRIEMPNGDPLKVVFVASEVVGFSKTGGLADVIGSLPQAVATLGHSCAVFTPLYRCCRNVSLRATRSEARRVVNGVQTCALPILQPI